MKLNPAIATALISAVLALEAWTLKTVIGLEVHMAELHVRVSSVESKLDDLNQTKTAKRNEHGHTANSLTLDP